MYDLGDLISAIILLVVGAIVITALIYCGVSDNILKSQPKFDGFVVGKFKTSNVFGEQFFYIKVQYAVAGKKRERYLISKYRVSYPEYNSVEIGLGVEFDENNQPIWNVPT